MKLLLTWLPLPITVVATSTLGAVLGYASSEIYVIGLAALTMGLTAGAVVSVVSLLAVGSLVPRAWLCAGLGVLSGWLVLQGAEDAAFQAHWRQDYAAAQQAAAGVDPGAGLGADEQAFYSEGADSALDAQVVAVSGVGGASGRWLFRAESGVRLLGPARGGRGLPVGRVGAMIWSILEILLALLVAQRLLSRVKEALSQQAESERGLDEF
ncbi:MAG: hypothetical protein ACPGU1_06810 [Myxococcota bacterium]